MIKRDDDYVKRMKCDDDDENKCCDNENRSEIIEVKKQKLKGRNEVRDGKERK